jgi:hypothetical protein
LPDLRTSGLLILRWHGEFGMSNDLFHQDKPVDARVPRLCVRRISAAALIAASLFGATSLVADGLSTDDVHSNRAAKVERSARSDASRSLETWPSLDHHYRNDMVEPGWRTYPQNNVYIYERDPYRNETGPYARGPHASGAYGPADARLRRQEQVQSSLDRTDSAYRCEPWRSGCARENPW